MGLVPEEKGQVHDVDLRDEAAQGPRRGDDEIDGAELEPFHEIALVAELGRRVDVDLHLVPGSLRHQLRVFAGADIISMVRRRGGAELERPRLA